MSLDPWDDLDNDSLLKSEPDDDDLVDFDGDDDEERASADSF